MIRFSDATALSTARSMLADGLITNEDFNHAISISKESNKPLIEVFLEYNYLTELDIRDRISRNYSLPIIDFSDYKAVENIEKILPYKFVKDNQILPYNEDENAISVALADPSSLNTLSQIKTFTSKNINPHVCLISDLENIFSRHFSMETPDNFVNSDELIQQSLSKDVISFVDTILSKAIQMDVSDIHIEPSGSGRIRFRKDGILIEQTEFSETLKDKYNEIVVRIKILANVNIAERRLPQDSKISYEINKKSIDLRVSFLPTSKNQRVVLRILDKSNLNITLDGLGFNKEEGFWVADALKSSQGLILVTGPTGSGKTTTLYSMLSSINKPEINILTAEDPVEYDLDGISQVQVREDIGLTFASALRSFLRQDPEVILVGEIRDTDTADIAIKASLTGHLVLSTLHTNDAPSTITRMIDMGVPRYLIASSLCLIIAQRLVRKLCSCSVSQDKEAINLEDIKKWNLIKADINNFKMPKGCKKCNSTGFSGRRSIYQILNINTDLRSLIIAGATEKEIENAAKEKGMLNLSEVGVNLLKQGIISFGELERVVSA